MCNCGVKFLKPWYTGRGGCVTADNSPTEAYSPLINSQSGMKSRSNSLADVMGETILPNGEVYGSICIEDPYEKSDEATAVDTKKPRTYVKFQRSHAISDIPWKAFFTHPATLVLFLSHWTFSWIGYMLLTEIPSYLTDELGYDLTSSGLLSIAPYAANFVAVIVFAMMFEEFQVNKGWNDRSVRQVASQIAYGGSSLCLIACGFMDIPGLAFTFMVFALFCYGAAQCGIACCYLDVAPNFSSMTNTIGNTFGAVAGLAGPLVVSVCITHIKGSWGWRVVFFITMAQAVITLLLLAKYQSSEVIHVLNTPYKR